MPRSSVALLALALACAATPVPAAAQNGPVGPGQACTPGQFAYSGLLLVCGEDARLRYALHEDIPAAPDGGHRERPSWYPALSQVMLAPRTPACPATGRVTFTNPVVRIDDLLPIIPQGMMVADHVTPIDHGYLGVRGLAKPRAQRTDADFVPVTAPADAVIIEVSLLGSPTSIRVVMAHGCETYSIYLVLNRVSGALAHLHDELMQRQYLRTDIAVQAGDTFGLQRDNPLDFSIHDGAAWLPGFLAPFSYTTLETWKPYTVDPWRYFSPDLAEAYEGRMQRVAAPRWGLIDLDVPGTPVGNWFIQGTLGYAGFSVERVRNGDVQYGTPEGKNTYAWGHLAVARHWVQPASWVFSTGWWADERGDPKQMLIELGEGQPEPAHITADRGMVVYRLRDLSTSAPREPGDESPWPINYGVIGGQVTGVVALQVNADQTLSVETFPGQTDPARVTAFTAARRTYRR